MQELTMVHENPDGTHVTIRLYHPTLPENITISPEAYLDENIVLSGSVTIGPGSSIGHNTAIRDAVIEPNVTIGKDCDINYIGPSIRIGAETIIGNRSRIAGNIGAASHLGHKTIVKGYLPPKTRIGNRSSIVLRLPEEEAIKLEGKINVGQSCDIEIRASSPHHPLLSLTAEDRVSAYISEIGGHVTMGAYTHIGTYFMNGSDPTLENPSRLISQDIPAHSHIPYSMDLDEHSGVITYPAPDGDSAKTLTLVVTPSGVSTFAPHLGDESIELPPATLSMMHDIVKLMKTRHDHRVKTLEGRARAATAHT